MKIIIKTFIFIILLALILAINPNFSQAAFDPRFGTTIVDDKGSGSSIEDKHSNDVTEHPSAFKPNGMQQEDADTIIAKVSGILGAITTVGVVVSVITILLLGIKFMMGSVQEKAEYKKSMLPYLIGVIFLFNTSIIVKIIANLVLQTDLSKDLL